MSTSRLWALVVTLALALGSFGLAACGSSSDNTDTSGGGGGGTGGVDLSSVKADPAVVKLVPADVKSGGSLSMATDASYPPIESFASDGTTIIGVDPDLAKAMAAKMGLTVDVAERQLRQHHHRDRGRQVRLLDVRLHRHQGARGDG